MNSKESFINKIESNLEQAQVTFARLRSQSAMRTAGNREKHDRQVLEIDLKIDALKIKLKELNDANEGAWEQLTDGVENTWTSLQATLQDVVTSFDD